LLIKELAKKQEGVESSEDGNCMNLQCFSERHLRKHVTDKFRWACQLEGWASARDVLTVANSIFSSAIRASSSGLVDVTEALVCQEIDAFVAEKESRAQAERISKGQTAIKLPVRTATNPEGPAAPSPATASSTATGGAGGKTDTSQDESDKAQQSRPISPSNDTFEVGKTTLRDAGVSDEVWDQLQLDTQEEEKRKKEYQAKPDAEKTASGEVRDRIVKELLEEEARGKKEKKIKRKLDQRGVCPRGFVWIHQQDGWRCAGGGHFVSDEDAAQM
jgi:hypothetical protein